MVRMGKGYFAVPEVVGPEFRAVSPSGGKVPLARPHLFFRLENMGGS